MDEAYAYAYAPNGDLFCPLYSFCEVLIRKTIWANMSCESVASSTPKSTLHAKTLLQRYKNFMKRNHSMQKKLQKETKNLLFRGKMASKQPILQLIMCNKGTVRWVLVHSTQVHPKLYPNCSHTTASLKSMAGSSHEYGYKQPENRQERFFRK